MNTTKIEKLLELIHELVNDDSSNWRAKRDAVLAVARDEGDTTALEEFAAWFEPEDHT